MFGFRHWQMMHLLVAQSGAGYLDGLEHEDSPFNAIGDAGLGNVDELAKFENCPLLRPRAIAFMGGQVPSGGRDVLEAGLSGPERTSLLWVYEGLNQYVGLLLATRAGFSDAAYARDNLASCAAAMAFSPGSSVRLRSSTPPPRTGSFGRWTTVRDRCAGVKDYLRRESADLARSRRDHPRAGGGSARSTISSVPLRPARYRSDRRHVHARGRRGRSGGRSGKCDWHAVIESRVYAVNAAAPTRGFDASGWRLIYNALPNADKFIPPLASPQGVQMFTIGALVRNDGTIDDVVAGSPAYEAGLGPHMSIVSVNGRSFIAR